MMHRSVSCILVVACFCITLFISGTASCFELRWNIGTGYGRARLPMEYVFTGRNEVLLARIAPLYEGLTLCIDLGASLKPSKEIEFGYGFNGDYLFGAAQASALIKKLNLYIDDDLFVISGGPFIEYHPPFMPGLYGGFLTGFGSMVSSPHDWHRKSIKGDTTGKRTMGRIDLRMMLRLGYEYEISETLLYEVVLRYSVFQGLDAGGRYFLNIGLASGLTHVF